MKIYKYLSQSGAIKTLNNSSVLLKNPADYNDPFDSLFYVDEKERKKAFRLFFNYRLFKEMYRVYCVDKKVPVRYKTYARILITNMRQTAKILEKTKTYKYQPDIGMYQVLVSKMVKTDMGEMKNQFNEMLEKVLLKAREVALVSCFGLDNKSILMWSHYAEKHEGACFEYEIPDGGDFRLVEYRKKFPVLRLTKLLSVLCGHDFFNEKVDGNNSLFSFVLKPLLTKSEDWKYEKEVRCIFAKDEKNERLWVQDGMCLLKMPKPTKIFLGCKSSDSFADEIKEKAKGIPIEHMGMSNGKYGIE